MERKAGVKQGSILDPYIFSRGPVENDGHKSRIVYGCPRKPRPFSGWGVSSYF
jgi:hypothetical protein